MHSVHSSCCMSNFPCKPLGCVCAQIHTEEGNHIIEKDDVGGRQWGGLGRERRRSELRICTAREEREKERGEEDVMSTAMDESTLEWEKAEERATRRKIDEA